MKEQTLFKFITVLLLLIGTNSLWAQGEQFQFQITVPDSDLTFAIPTSGGNGDKAYSWDISWGDDVDSLGVTGISASSSAGISHTYSATGTYTITITPNSSTDAWLAAFGFWNNTNGANVKVNKVKVSFILSEFTPLMTRTAVQINSNTAPDYEWARTFYDCKKLTCSGPGFSSGWAGITTVGNYFAYSMFQNCSSYAFAMNEVFNLPESITTAGDFFAVLMFGYCSGGTFTMNEIFNLPEGITIVGNNFASAMFRGCSGNAFTMNEVFNLPEGITTAGNSFAFSMFEGCSGGAFTMNEVFNLPTEITLVRHNFAYHMFAGCSGDAFTMNEVFNFPKGITSVGQCFATDMFYNCSGDAFKVNELFQFQQNAYGQTIVGLPLAYFETFYGVTNAQDRTAQSIIGNLTEPTIKMYTFTRANGFSDREYIAVNWGGDGLSSVTPTDMITNFEVSEAYPNPFNPNTTIDYQLPDSRVVSANVYGLNGEKVRTLFKSQQDAGYYSVQFNADDLPSGMYICRISAGTDVKTLKLLLLK